MTEKAIHNNSEEFIEIGDGEKSTFGLCTRCNETGFLNQVGIFKISE